MRDFEGRCAYSMQHHTRSGPLEVDHFDPAEKKELVQRYANLFPASRLCNGKKSDWWPTREELQAGCRFLNPCEEMDCGEQIVENPLTGELIGLNNAARWHIRVCGLNSALLVQERQKRALLWKTIKGSIVTLKRTNILGTEGQKAVVDLADKFRQEVLLMIPEIPFAAERSVKGKAPLGRRYRSLALASCHVPANVRMTGDKLSDGHENASSLLADLRVPSESAHLHRRDSTLFEGWCAREDLNLQSFRNQILSLARLPIPPRAQPRPDCAARV